MSEQQRLVDAYRVDSTVPVSKESRCRKCSRPHVPFGPHCAPCEIIAAKAYHEAPPAPEAKGKEDG